MLCFDQALQLVKCVTATCLKPPMIFFNRLLHTDVGVILSEQQRTASQRIAVPDLEVIALRRRLRAAG